MFVLIPQSPLPLYTQLYQQLRDHILSGKLPSNSRLPSVRDLASELSASRNTVENAYQELYAEGYIYSKPRSGYFVSALSHEDLSHLPLKQEARVSYPQENRPGCDYDFHPARLDRDSFPAPLWRKNFVECLRESSAELSDTSDPQGELELRCQLQKYLERSRGVLCDPEQIVICSGLQHSLGIVAQLLQDKHCSVAVENPGYSLPGAVFRNHRFQVLPVDVGPGGMDLDALQDSVSTIAYVTPSHQFPTGSVMPVANRLKLIDWADSGGRFIIEDDYDSELRYHGKPIPSLQGLRPRGNIIYLGTFSKVLSPALRVSYLVLPACLLPAYQNLFRDYLCNVSLLEQRTLAAFMQKGHWDRHVRRMRTIYKKKHDTLLRAIENHFGARAEVIGQGAGLHVVLQLRDQALSERELISRAQSGKVLLFPFSGTYAGGAPGSLKFLIGFGGLSAHQIEEGVKLLFDLWYR
jgi:GntR family transcriptional regulator / MocR family aminotransferase